MRYVCTPGVVMVKICGTRLLVPSHDAYESCPHAISLTLPAAMGWAILKSGKPVSDVEKVFSILTKKPPEEVAEIVEKVLSELVKAGALRREEDEA